MKPALLIVEDSRDHAELAVAVLREAAGDELKIVCAASLHQAQAECLRTAFDAIVLDLGLPGSTGLETLRRLRKICTAPLVVLSGAVNHSGRVQAILAGACTAISKDDLEALPRAVANAIQQGAAGREDRRVWDAKLDTVCGVLEQVQADVAVIRLSLFTGRSGPGLLDRAAHNTRLAWLAVVCSLTGWAAWVIAAYTGNNQ